MLLGDTPLSTDLALAADAVIPAGAIVAWPDTVIPAGWLLCDGLDYAQAGFPDLYAAIGGAFNQSGGLALPAAGRFRVPPLVYSAAVGAVGRMPIGRDTADLLGAAGGALGHVHGVGGLSIPDHGHGAGSLQARAHGHGHNLSAGSHDHSLSAQVVNGVYSSDDKAIAFGQTPGFTGQGTPPVSGGIADAGAIGLTGATGGITDFASALAGNVAAGDPPMLELNWIIKT